jgi:hypothetical protein
VVLNKVTVSVLATSRFSTLDSGMVTAIKDRTSYREMLNAARQQQPIADLRLPWSRYHNWLWHYQLGEDYQNAKPSLMVKRLVPLVTPISVSVSSKLLERDDVRLERVDAQLVWHPFAVTTVANLLLAGDSWHVGSRLATALNAVLRSWWSGTTTQVRNGLPMSATSLAWDRDAAGRCISTDRVSRATVISGLHHAENEPKGLAYSLASLVEPSATHAGFPMHVPGSFLAVTDRRVGVVLPNSMRDAKRRHHCLHANTTTLLALLQNLLTLQGGIGQYAEWYGSKADAVLRHLYQRNPYPSTDTVYKSRLAQVWLDKRGIGNAYAGAGNR